MSGPIDQELQDPQEFPVIVETDHQDMWIETPKDINNEPIVNAAKQLPLKPIFVLQSVAVYKITKITGSYSNGEWRNEHNTLNSSTWRTWARGEAWCACKWRTTNYNNQPVVEVTYTVRCLRGGWFTKIPEAAHEYLDGANLKDWATEEGSITIGKLTSSGGKASVSSDLIVTDWDTKRLVSFSFLPP